VGELGLAAPFGEDDEEEFEVACGDEGLEAGEVVEEGVELLRGLCETDVSDFASREGCGKVVEPRAGRT
jgi:hypothetical protein